MKSLVRGALAFILAAAVLIAVTGSASASDVHIVQPGETLSEIAEQYGATVADLQALNDLPDADFVWYGQRLLIQPADPPAPDPQTAAAQTPAPQPATTDPPAPDPDSAGDYQLYTAQPGDTLFLLAGKHGISLSKLMSINGFTSEDWIQIGQELLVPRALAPAPPPAYLVTAQQPAPPFAEMEPGRVRPAFHTVQTDETLADIAAWYGVNPAALARLNGLPNDAVPGPGQTLRVPSMHALELLEEMSARLAPDRYPTRTERWIEVDLNEQMAIAYEDDAPVKVFIISSGVAASPTVTGVFRIWGKIVMQDMRGGSRVAGDAYHVTEVKNVQYFHEDYGFHGTYWHSNFGAPMSRGCINMTDEDAKWLFDWASPTMHAPDDDDGWLFSTDANPGTLVFVHE
jgi:LysM repeat protein